MLENGGDRSIVARSVRYRCLKELGGEGDIIGLPLVAVRKDDGKGRRCAWKSVEIVKEE